MRAKVMSKSAFWTTMGCLAALVMATPARATTFFDEDFPTDGDLTTVNTNWTPYSGATGTKIVVSNGAAVVQGKNIGSGEDASRTTGNVLGDGQTWYYGTRFTVLDVNANNSWNSEYFIGFRADTIGSFTLPLTARTYISTSSDPAKYSLGISSNGADNGGQIKPWTEDLSFNTSYVAIVSYTSLDSDGGTTSDGYTSLWINPTSQASPSVTDSMPNTTLTGNTLYDNAHSVFLRQGNGLAGTPEMRFDDIAAGTTFADVYNALVGVTPTDDADFDADGDIDGADFLIWQRGVGTGGGQPQGNADGLGGIDGDDLAVWEGQFGTAVAASQPIPEPASLALALLGGLAAVGFRRSS